MNSIKSQKGFSLASILAVLVIGGLLYVGYSSLVAVKEGVPGDPTSALTASNDVACEMNRKALANALLNWTVRNPGREPSLKALKESGVTVPDCPGGGRFQLTDDKITCSLHSRD
jgi:hypothetical protein